MELRLSVLFVLFIQFMTCFLVVLPDFVPLSIVGLLCNKDYSCVKLYCPPAHKLVTKDQECHFFYHSPI